MLSLNGSAKCRRMHDSSTICTITLWCCYHTYLGLFGIYRTPLKKNPLLTTVPRGKYPHPKKDEGSCLFASSMRVRHSLVCGFSERGLTESRRLVAPALCGRFLIKSVSGYPIEGFYPSNNNSVSRKKPTTKFEVERAHSTSDAGAELTRQFNTLVHNEIALPLLHRRFASNSTRHTSIRARKCNQWQCCLQHEIWSIVRQSWHGTQQQSRQISRRGFGVDARNHNEAYQVHGW